MLNWKGLRHYIAAKRVVLSAALSVIAVPTFINLATAILQKGSIEISNSLERWATFVLAVIVAGLLLLWWGRNDPRVVVVDDEKPKPHKGLIVMLGPGRGGDIEQQSARPSIEFHRQGADGQPSPLSVVWLIATTTDKAEVIAYATKLKAEYEKRGLTVHVKRLHDAFHLQEAYEVIDDIYNNLPDGLGADEVIADFTGGTAVMTAGMVLACGKDRHLQYTTGGKEGIPSAPMSVAFQPRGRAAPAQAGDA